MEVYVPTSTRFGGGRSETSRQRLDTEAPVTMIMASGDEFNREKVELARKTAADYKRMISQYNDIHQLLTLKVGVIDFMSFVDYGNGRSLPAEVGLASGKLVSGKVSRMYGEIPHIPLNVQTPGYAWDAKDSCNRIHGIDILEERPTKIKLSALCSELKEELDECQVIMCRSEDLIRVLGAYDWLQNLPAGSRLPDIPIVLIEDFLVHTLNKLQQIGKTMEGGVPSFSQFTTLLASSANDLEEDFRCDYHNTVEAAWDKPGCARKNAKKYMSMVLGCINRAVVECKRVEQDSSPLSNTSHVQQDTLHVWQDTLHVQQDTPRSRNVSSGSSSSSSYQSAISQQQEISYSSGGRSSTSPPRRESSASPSVVHNPLGLLSPEFFTKPPGSEQTQPGHIRERASHVTRQTSHVSLAPPSTPAVTGYTSTPAATGYTKPRRPQSYSARKKLPPENESAPPLPSAGPTNLEKKEPIPRRPVSTYDTKGNKKDVSNPPSKTRGRRGTSTVPVTDSYNVTSTNTHNVTNTNAHKVTNTNTHKVTNTNAHNVTNAHNAPISSDTVLVPSTVVATLKAPSSHLIFDLEEEEVEGPLVSPHPAFKEAFSTSPPNSQQAPLNQSFKQAPLNQSINPLMQIMLQAKSQQPAADVVKTSQQPAAKTSGPPPGFVKTSGPPPGFGPIPQYSNVPAGFRIAPPRSKSNRANHTASVDDTEHFNSPSKKRGRK